MYRSVPINSAIVFPVGEAIEYLRDWIPIGGNEDIDPLIDLVTATYVSAFCVLFPFSRVQFNKIELVSIRLAQTLCTIGTSRLIDCINYRSVIHVNQNTLIQELHAACEVIFEIACSNLQQLFDPDNKELCSSGVSGEYDIRVTDCANGHLIKAVFSEKRYNQPSSAPAQSRQSYLSF